jgi:hypothetical protein
LRVVAEIERSRAAAGDLADDFEATDLLHRRESTERTSDLPGRPATGHRPMDAFADRERQGRV